MRQQEEDPRSAETGVGLDMGEGLRQGQVAAWSACRSLWSGTQVVDMPFPG